MDAPKPRRRWFAFSLRTLLVAVGVLALWLGYMVHAARQQQRAVSILGADAYYDFQCNSDGYPLLDFPDEPPEPIWLTELLGKDFLHSVVSVMINNGSSSRRREAMSNLRNLKGLRTICMSGSESGPDDGDLESLDDLTHLERFRIDNSCLTNEGLRRLAAHSGLVVLHLSNGRFDDEGLRHLARLTHLRSLVLSNNKISDEGLRHLVSLLPKLEYLDLRGTHITPEAIEELKQTSPIPGVLSW